MIQYCLSSLFFLQKQGVLPAGPCGSRKLQAVCSGFLRVPRILWAPTLLVKSALVSKYKGSCIPRQPPSGRGTKPRALSQEPGPSCPLSTWASGPRIKSQAPNSQGNALPNWTPAQSERNICQRIEEAPETARLIALRKQRTKSSSH